MMDQKTLWFGIINAFIALVVLATRGTTDNIFVWLSILGGEFFGITYAQAIYREINNRLMKENNDLQMQLRQSLRHQD